MAQYDDLAARAEAGQLPAKASTARRGNAAAEAARAALIEATGADSLEAAVTIARGRPRLDADAPEGVTWKVRATKSLDRETRMLAKSQEVFFFQLVRDATASYVLAAR